MGSPVGEGDDDEKPQHSVTVQPFLMGKYPVTQAQWQAVATFPKVDLDLAPDPSRSKGKNRPVERVSWHQAVEFCQRLSRHTVRDYRLPSEAEWEYACRAGTSTPYHFGQQLISKVANFSGSKTTEVGSFGVANGFGLYDMHGNVWEWCKDTWHENYRGTPTDGSAWVKGGDQRLRVLRGGSWNFNHGNCRSANRVRDIPVFTFDNIGFRVVCSAPRT
jgi:formylglycine-generating enzyme required for sulfatase activity